MDSVTVYRVVFGQAEFFGKLYFVCNENVSAVKYNPPDMSESKLASWLWRGLIILFLVCLFLTSSREEGNIIKLATVSLRFDGVCCHLFLDVSFNVLSPSAPSIYFWLRLSISSVFNPYFLPSTLSLFFSSSSIPPSLCILLLQTYDKCFLGSSETADVNRVFCGQMGAVYLFGEALSAAQILAIYQLGPGYQVKKHKSEMTCHRD